MVKIGDSGYWYLAVRCDVRTLGEWYAEGLIDQDNVLDAAALTGKGDNSVSRTSKAPAEYLTMFDGHI